CPTRCHLVEHAVHRIVERGERATLIVYAEVPRAAEPRERFHGHRCPPVRRPAETPGQCHQQSESPERVSALYGRSIKLMWRSAMSSCQLRELSALTSGVPIHYPEVFVLVGG